MVWFIFGIIILIACVFIVPGIFKTREKTDIEKANHLQNLINDENVSRYDKEHYKERMEAYQDDAKASKTVTNILRIGGMVLAVFLVALSLVATVPTGYTGIVTTFGKVSDTTLASGINFKLPWQNVINMDNREQKSPFSLEAFSKDIQQVDVQGSINLNIDKSTAMNLYKDVGVEYMTILVQPRVLEDVKIVIARYTAEKLVENRQACSDQIFELLKSELSEKGINVISFAIENIDFTDAFESAVEAKQVATQEKQKAQTEQERQTMEMQQKAERDRIQANAAADVLKIDAEAKAYAVKIEAEAQAEANKKLSESLTSELIQYNTIKQWDGKVPVVQSGNGNSNIIDIRSLLGD